MPKNHFINAYRKPIERRVRYCFLRQCGLPRSIVRGICGRSDRNIALTLENLPWSALKTDNIKALYTESMKHI